MNSTILVSQFSDHLPLPPVNPGLAQSGLGTFSKPWHFHSLVKTHAPHKKAS